MRVNIAAKYKKNGALTAGAIGVFLGAKEGGSLVFPADLRFLAPAVSAATISQLSSLYGLCHSPQSALDTNQLPPRVAVVPACAAPH